MKTYYKILIDLRLWHLKPYCILRSIQNVKIYEYGFLCLKFIKNISLEEN